ncbi:uncharacterized protein [Pyxicephalus adspersus]|uniref:uncharacterized protein isoform X2 n=1 Tax=Pyxicephalus adspersus TaxID=30357 RepID=UPI003B58DFE6
MDPEIPQRDVPVLCIPGIPNRRILASLNVIRYRPQEEQMFVKVEIKEEEEMSVMDYRQPMEEVGMMVTIKQEEPSIDITTDGSSDGNPPERCPLPPYSRNSTAKDEEIPHHFQREDLQDVNIVVIKEENYGVLIEEFSMDDRNPPESCPRPPYFQNSRWEHQEIPYHYQEEYLNNIRVEVKKEPEDQYVMGDDRCKKEKIPEIITDDHYQSPTTPPDLRQTPASRATPESLKKFQCPDCDKWFSTNSQILSHQTTHAGEKPFSCHECGRNFAKKSYLVNHMMVHTGEKPYSCHICGKCFRRQAYLCDHQHVHTGVRPYTCPECGKSFPFRWSLARHMRIHSRKEPCFCPECGKSFIGLSNLNTHFRTHLEEKLLSCTKCRVRFTSKLEFESHKCKHTGDKHEV